MTGPRLVLLAAFLISACGGRSSMSGTGGGSAGGRGGATAGNGGAGRGGAGGTIGGRGGAIGEAGTGGTTAGGGAGGDAGSGGATAGGGAGGAGGGGAGRGGASGAPGTGGTAAGTGGTNGTGGTSAALPTNIAFVTSTRVMPDFGGVAGGDTICQMHAQSAGLAGTYRAWLASSAGSARSRLGAARGWRRADGLPIADTAASLLGDPRLFYLLNVNERGARTYATYVWTGTATGANGNASPDTCGDWTSQAEGQWGATGNGNLASIAWTAGGRNECALAQPLYCFGIDHANPVAAPARPNPSRFVFTSRPFTLSGAGLAAADAFCNGEATVANLPGTYAALLTPLMNAANERFEPTAGGPWARLDGVVPSATPLASTTQALRAALNVASDGTYLTDGSVWTGALTPVDTNSSLNCNAFTSTSSTASSIYGTVHDSVEWWSPSPADTVPCNATTVRLYCLQR